MPAGNYEIYTMNATGTLQTRLAASAVDDLSPDDADQACSPDSREMTL